MRHQFSMSQCLPMYNFLLLFFPLQHWTFVESRLHDSWKYAWILLPCTIPKCFKMKRRLSIANFEKVQQLANVLTEWSIRHQDKNEDRWTNVSITEDTHHWRSKVSEDCSSLPTSLSQRSFGLISQLTAFPHCRHSSSWHWRWTHHERQRMILTVHFPKFVY